MDKVSFGYESVSPAEKRRRVGAVFTSVAARYDLMNDLMSGGLHRLWKDRFARRIRPRPGEHILDMAGGTGDIAFRLAARGAHVTVADINREMLERGLRRARRRGIDGLEWRAENAEALSFADASFDAYAIAFGIRNVADISSALAEAHRVLRIGGRFFCLEFSRAQWPGFAEIYDRYSLEMVPRMGRLIARDAESYRYLVESIRRFPDAEAFAAMIGDAGFSNVRAEPILGGVVAVHSGWKT
ncbi:MAG: class I SAM-dependent methyltransferase [Sphingomonadaceae bacterium]